MPSSASGNCCNPTIAPSPAQKASIDQILHAGWYLLELINEILDLALIESGKLSISLEPVLLDDLMLECQSMIEPQAEKRVIRMLFPRFAQPCFVNADRTRVKQILVNLLSNAIKYNHVGGSVEVEVSCIAPPQGRTRVSIRDTGAGLPPEKLAQLFQPFNRLGQEASAEEGTGIGLVVTKRLVELMGGAIGVSSIVGVGSVFWVELDSAEPTSSTQGVTHPALAAPTLVDSPRPVRTLLYVEDNTANLKLIEQLIARRPELRLLTAINGTLGIQLARSTLPEVILMDINLPGMSGTDVMRQLRRDPLTAHIPVIALSANAIPHDIARGLEAGFFQYLTKPVRVNDFMQALDTALAFTQSGSDSAIQRELV
jgi:CheY-like chemotaxis protein